MGELAARELADDLVEEWHNLDEDVPLFAYLALTIKEYARWVAYQELPPDFEKRHGV